MKRVLIGIAVFLLVVAMITGVLYFVKQNTGADNIVPVPAPKTVNEEAVCTSIANDEALRSLPSAMSQLFGLNAGAAKASVRIAITRMEEISQDADEPLSSKLKNAADMLDILVSAQTPTEEMVDNAVSALTDLSDEVQTLCEFSDA